MKAIKWVLYEFENASFKQEKDAARVVIDAFLDVNHPGWRSRLHSVILNTRLQQWEVKIEPEHIGYDPRRS